MVQGIDYEHSLLDSLESSIANAREIQEHVLDDILTRNSYTEYLQRYGLSSSCSDKRQVFKDKVPIIKYEDVKREIQRIADGETTTPILCVDPVTHMYTSSGTSGGEHKLFPKVEGHYKLSKHYFDLVTAILNKHIPDVNKGKALYFMYVRKMRQAKGGLPASPALTGYYNSSEFRNETYDPNIYTSPLEVILCTDTHQAMYSHLLCGLIQSKEVVKLGSFFASSFVRSIRSLEGLWQEICQDIRSGILSSRITDEDVRNGVERILKSDPELADEIEKHCREKSWKGIIKKLWPNAKVIDTVISGSMEQYYAYIHHFTDSSIPVASTMYASSESYFGINLTPLIENPSEVSYLFLPATAYFEFLPLTRSEDDSSDTTVELLDVKLGVEYELLVTTNAGLYRYKMGDVVKVAGFYKGNPLFNFIRRSNVVLSIDSDKTDEKELQIAVNRGMKRLIDAFKKDGEDEVRLVDFTAYVELTSNPAHYVIFWELSNKMAKNMDDKVMEECCYEMESTLSVVYKRGRVEGAIGPLEIRLVEEGSFEKIAEDVASKGGNIAQYKTPRCLKNPSHLHSIQCGVYSAFISPQLPPYHPVI